MILNWTIQRRRTDRARRGPVMQGDPPEPWLTGQEQAIPSKRCG